MQTRLTAPFWDNAGFNSKVKPNWIFLKQETVSGSGISWAVCQSAPRSRQPRQHPTTLKFFTGWMPFLNPTNSVKALKAQKTNTLEN